MGDISPPKRDFTGRTDELEELLAKVQTHGGAMIYGMRGMGGVGKTELAYMLLSKIGDEYPDVQLFIDLHCASAEPLSLAEALKTAIRAFEPNAKLPEAVPQLRQIYLTALKNRRVLVLLDNA